jgi:hypothetical protein
LYCRDCPRFDQENERCLDQKVNPQRREQAVEVANILGLRAICVFNDFRETLVQARKNPPGSKPRKAR